MDQIGFYHLTGLSRGSSLNEDEKIIFKLAKKRAIPLTRFTLKSFKERLLLQQKARLVSIKQWYPNYEEKDFSRLVNLLDLDISLKPTRIFLEKFWARPRFNLSTAQLKAETKRLKDLPPNDPNRPSSTNFARNLPE